MSKKYITFDNTKYNFNQQSLDDFLISSSDIMTELASKEYYFSLIFYLKEFSNSDSN